MMSRKLKRLTLRTVLIYARNITAFFLFIACFVSYNSYENCEICKNGYHLPALSELKTITGTYVLVPRSRRMGQGGILTDDQARPALCGYLKQELVGMPAKGWFDADGNIYQLEVGGQLVCDYESIIENKKNSLPMLYFTALVSLILFILLSIILFLLMHTKSES